MGGLTLGFDFKTPSMGLTFKFKIEPKFDK